MDMVLLDSVAFNMSLSELGYLSTASWIAGSVAPDSSNDCVTSQGTAAAATDAIFPKIASVEVLVSTSQTDPTW